MAITDNLVAWWDLSEASLTRHDSIGDANPLTDTNTVTGTTGPGSHNASLFTKANSEKLTHIDNATLSVGDIDFTIAIWVKPTTITSSDRIGGSDNGANTDMSWLLGLEVSPNRIFFAVSSNGVLGTGTFRYSTDTVTAGNWYFVVGWHDATANTINLQLNNGTPVSSAHSTGVWNTSSPFVLGEANEGGFFLDGALALCGLWKRVLTTDERTLLYNGGSGLSFAELPSAGLARINTQSFPKYLLAKSNPQARFPQ